jgi:hypothetical protein
MKKIYASKPNTPVVPPHRSFRRFINRVFNSLLKHQVLHEQDAFQKELMQRLQKIEDLIAREMRPAGKRRK